MEKILKRLKTCVLALTLLASITSAVLSPSTAEAQPITTETFTTIRAFSPGDALYNGLGFVFGLQQAQRIQDIDEDCIGSACLRRKIGNAVNLALSFAALIAVTVIIIGGFYLLLGLGSDTSRDNAKRIIIFTGVGLIILLLAKTIVAFFILIPQGTQVS